MKTHVRILAVAALLAVLSGVFVTDALASPPSNPFIGAWESTDIDGSYQRLAITGGPGGAHRVNYRDFGATVCGLDPDTGDFLYAASARGSGTVSGSDLTGTWSVWCLSNPPTFFGDLAFQFTYDASTDTLTDGLGVVWSRP